MNTDVIIVGAELDAFIASIRLQELGYSSRVLANGKGSYLYSSGNIKVLDLKENNNSDKKTLPFFIEGLPTEHPYKLIGKDNVEQAIEWFFNHQISNKLRYGYFETNTFTISPIGLKIPSYGLYFNQINFENIYNKDVTIIEFQNQKDFHAELIAQSIKQYVNTIEILNVVQPDTNQHLDSSSLAVSFDNLSSPDDYFININKKINKKTSVVIFPAVLGLNKYMEIIRSAEKTFSKKCFEAPTLPPSIPGIRLNKILEREVLKKNYIHRGSHILKANIENNKCLSVVDNFNRIIKARAFIFANGGILMGGIKVKSNGEIVEEIFDSKIQNNNHGKCEKSYETLNALQTSGVLTDNKLRPISKSNNQLENVFFTGRNLSNWNPSLELSGEGVSIASGWHSANNISSYLHD